MNPSPPLPSCVILAEPLSVSAQRRAEAQRFVETALLPGLEQVASELRSMPNLEPRISTSPEDPNTASLSVIRQYPTAAGAPALRRVAFLCAVRVLMRPARIVAQATIAPDVSGQRLTGAARTVILTSDTDDAGMLIGWSPTGIHDQVNAWYESTARDLQQLGF